MQKTLIITPVSIKPGEGPPMERYTALDAFSDAGQWIALYHSPYRGLWAELAEAYAGIAAYVERHPAIECIVHNFAPLYYSQGEVQTAAHLVFKEGYDHAVGVRENISAFHLMCDRAAGLERAHMECFFSVLAALRLNEPHMLADGFSPLQAFSRERWLAWQWDWVAHASSCGELEGQVQSEHRLFNICPFFLPHRHGAVSDAHAMGFKALENMIDDARRLPILEGISPDECKEALVLLPKVFSRQTWLNPSSVAPQIRMIFHRYNAGEREPFHVF